MDWRTTGIIVRGAEVGPSAWLKHDGLDRNWFTAIKEVVSASRPLLRESRCRRSGQRRLALPSL